MRWEEEIIDLEVDGWNGRSQRGKRKVRDQRPLRIRARGDGFERHSFAKRRAEAPKPMTPAENVRCSD